MNRFRARARPAASWMILALSCLFALLLGAFDVVFFKPTARRLAGLHSETVKRERGLALSARLVNQHPGVVQRVRVNSATNGPRLGLSNAAVELLTRTARRRGLDLDAVEPGSVETIGHRLITPISLNLVGSYVDFTSWLREVEASEVLCTIDRVFMEGSPTGQHQFHVGMSTYAFSPKE